MPHGGRQRKRSPELSAVGSRRSAAISAPNGLETLVILAERITQYISAVSTSSAAVRGIRVNEDSFTIQLRDAGGRYYSFRKAEFKELHRLEGQTPMPALEGQIGGASIDDLLAYLHLLKGTP